MSVSPLRAAVAPVALALTAALTFVASLGADAPAARTVDPGSPGTTAPAQVSPSVSIPRPGVSGGISSGPESADYDGDGVSEAVFGTERGFYRVALGEVLQYIPTSTEVRDFVHIGDVTGDGVQDVALALGDTTFPNIRAYDSASGDELWTLVPTQDVFLENLMWTSQQSATFDLVASDLGGNGQNELLATSGYRVYALDAATGDEAWHYEWSDNLWQVTPVGDLDGDGQSDVVAGSQDGYVVAISGADGAEIWSRQIADPFQAIDEKGSDWKLIDRSTWDILPIPGNDTEAVVTTEDGFVRRIDLSDGDVLWDQELLNRPAAQLSQVYRQRGGNPTSPGDSNFFNLRAKLVADISGDGQSDVLVTAFLGAGRTQDSRNPGIYVIDSNDGNLLWRNNTIDITTAERLDVFETSAGPVLAVPTRTPAYLDLATGQPASEAPIDLPPTQNNGRQGGAALLAMGGLDYLYASPTGDLEGVADGVEWSIARTTESQLIRGDFTGDEAEDILVSAGAGTDSNNFELEPRARLVYVIDGSSGELAWEYLVPDKQFETTGGIAGVRAVADVNGDGRQDVLGYMQDYSEINGDSGEAPGADSRVVLLDGASGAAIYDGPPVNADYYGLWDLVYRNDPEVLAIIRSRVSDRLGADLANAWQDEEQRLRNDFENTLFQRWEEFRQGEIQDYIAENGSVGSDEELRAQNEAQMDSDWANLVAERQSSFEAGLFDETNALRTIGADEVLISAYEDARRSAFETALGAERINTYDQWRTEFEQRLASGELGTAEGQAEFEASLEQNRSQVEQQWRDEFEASLEDQRAEWINDQTGGSLDIEAENELNNLQQQLANAGSWMKVDKRIVSVDVISYPDAESGVALFVTSGRDVFIIDLDGELLWTRSFDSGVYNTPLGGPETDMSFGLQVDWQRAIRVVPDRNGDGIGDLRFSSSNSLVFAESNLSADGLTYSQAEKINGPPGSENSGALAEVSDLTGDGVAEVALVHWRDNAPPEANIIDGVTGAQLLRLDNFDENSVSLAPTADFNGDSQRDVIMFERWVDGSDRPRLRVLAAGTGQTIWEFDEYRDLFVIGEIGYDGPIIPATAVDDINGDGVPELAVVKHLTWQPGGGIDVFDITRDEVISSIATEEINPNSTQEQLWAPGLLAHEVGDLNGDGSGEIAYVTAFGQSGRDKQYRLGVADLDRGQVIADFLVTGSSLVGLDAPGKFGVAGFSGDLFMLDVNNELTINLPGGGDGLTSPLTLEWDGAAAGSFSQVYVDGIEVARTNGEAVELNMRSGDHTVAVRSVDPSGRAVISSIDINVSKSQLARTVVLLLAVIVVIGTFWVPGRRMFDQYRVRSASA